MQILVELFVFQHFEYAIHPLLASTVSEEKSAINLIKDPFVKLEEFGAITLKYFFCPFLSLLSLGVPLCLCWHS